ncbi:hypothetical protein Ae201684P_019135 [Aphanomyces euteiches]|nr:hypothetical protein Ae201684P_019135 [Aphanomyces euteiches]
MMALRLMPSQFCKRSLAMLNGQPSTLMTLSKPPTSRNFSLASLGDAANASAERYVVPSAKVEALASNPEYTRIGNPLWLTKEGHFFLASHAPGTYESIDIVLAILVSFFVTAMLWYCLPFILLSNYATRALDSAGVTASLALTYRKPFPIEQPGFFHINLDRHDGRKAFFSARMEDGDGVVYSEATALFITPKA